MNVIVGLVGATDDEIGRARSLLGADGAEVQESSLPAGRLALLWVSDSPTVLAVEQTDRAAVAMLGSGVRRLSDDERRRTVDDGIATVLSGCPLDVAAVELADGVLRAAVVGVNHRLFRSGLRGGGHIVGSHLATVARVAGAEVDRSYEDFFLGYGFHPYGATTFAGVRAIDPGNLLEWTGADPVASKVAAPEVDVPAPTTRAAAIAGLRDTFFGALERQAGRDRRHAVLLGGFDSALVAAGLIRMGHEVETFTFGFGDERYEQRNIELVTSSLGTVHHTVPIRPDEIMARLERLPAVLNQPGVQPHYQLHTIIASEAIRARGFSHAFSGDGCDAVFLGYPTVNTRARLLGRLGAVPPPLVDAGLRTLSTSFAEDRLGHVARIARSTLRSRSLGMPVGGHLPSSCLDEVSLARLRLDHPVQSEPVEVTRQRLTEGLEGLDPIRLAFHGNGLNGQSRVKVDGSVMSTGVAHSSPFVDQWLKAYASSLPVELLRPDDSAARDLGKAVLIDMVLQEGLLDERIVRQPKQSPSDSPIDHWYTGRLRPRVLALLDDLPFPARRSYLESVLRPRWAEEQYRRRVSISHHALSAVGLLCSYAAFADVDR